MKILLIEDDERISSFLSRGLRTEGHVVQVKNDGETGLIAARDLEWDVIILDLMLPKMSGQDVCKILRSEENSTPILMLTAMDGQDNIIDGLRMGADDYLSKPFVFDELILRLEKLKRLMPEGGDSNSSDIIRHEDLVFDRSALIVTRNDENIELTSLEYTLLEFLMLEAKKVVSRARILQNVWGLSEDPHTNVVDVYIRRLRSKVDDNFDVKLIHTIRGRGYRFGAREV